MCELACVNSYHNYFVLRKTLLGRKPFWRQERLWLCTISLTFYCEKNSSKLCAEGAIGNLMNILDCSKNDMEQFWDIVKSPVHLILQTLGESSVTKVVSQFSW
jgi:hypothetical protein